jgi:penicillin-binding protein 2
MKNYHQIDPDEIFLDSSNLPDFNVHHFEGRIEKPIKKTAFQILFFFFLLVLTVFTVKAADLQVNKGEEFAKRSLNNTLRQIPIFAERGLIKDRKGKELAWNDQVGRLYLDESGFSHLVGYIGYPTMEESKLGKYAPKELIGRAGVERAFNDILEGGRGLKIEEVDVKGEVISEHVLQEPTHGESIELSIDAGIQAKLSSAIAELAERGGYQAGAGVILDVDTGEVLAMTNVPEYDSNVLSSGSDKEKINSYLTDKRQPFLNRAIRGLYAPGSIVKPVMALGVLNERVISPDKQIFSSGVLKIANPYVDGQFTSFKDWKAHGWVDVRRAIAVSSDIYFYVVGGGFEDQKGIGILNIDKYAKLLGYGEKTGIDLEGEEAGLIPTPEWKAKTFPNDPVWRLGNTYHTVIGQYGFQVTPLQTARTAAIIATSGKLVVPTVLKLVGSAKPKTKQITEISSEWYQVVREGMRMTVNADGGTATSLNLPGVGAAAKTGTAQVGVRNEYMNSLIIGFFPYEKPRYAFSVIMERAPNTTTLGAGIVMRQLFDWMLIYTPEYFTVN